MREIELLMSVPGVGFLSAAAIFAEIGSIHRFSSPSKLASYADLAPRLNQSGGRNKGSKTVRRSNKWLRDAMFNVARAAICSNDSFVREFLSSS